MQINDMKSYTDWRNMYEVSVPDETKEVQE